jgi:hypothetical protein
MLSEASYHNMTVGRIPSVEGGIQPTIVDAKGDLIAAVAADSLNRLAVGSNDQVLVADSTASTGLAWKSYGAQFVAGKNKMINGDFGVWQRGTSFSNPNNVYTADRWVAGTDATCTVSQQTFTPGTAPVAGYEGTYFYRAAKSAGGTYFQANQKIEDVRAFAGQSITVSFWAKAGAGLTLGVQGYQNFGSGGSSQVTALDTTVTLTTSWVRYSVSATLPSISGKTIGTSSYLMLPYFIYSSSSAATIDIWGVQVEAGSVATPFTTATGTIQGELAACYRYFQQVNPSSEVFGYCYATNSYVFGFTMPVTPRVIPTGITVVDRPNGLVYNQLNSSAVPSAITINAGGTSLNTLSLLATATGTAGNVGRLGSGTMVIQITGCEL